MADQNIFGTFGKAKELRQRILFTLGALIIYRLGTYIPVPGIRPGPPTADYLDFVLTRLTAIGALYLSAVCILPEILISKYSIPFYFGGTSLLIVVTVAIDTVTQAQSHMLAHQYSGLIKKRRLGGYSR